MPVESQHRVLDLARSLSSVPRGTPLAELGRFSGSLYFGAECSQRLEENLARVEEFETAVSVLGSDRDTARYYSRIKAGLKKKGKPIPDNDIWIAATARQHGLVLVTRDRHFLEIEGLENEAW